MQCDMRCNEDGMKKRVTTHTANDMAAHETLDSFHDHLDGIGSPFLEPFDSVLMKAKVVRMT